MMHKKLLSIVYMSVRATLTDQERNKRMFGINECSICGGRGYNRVPCDRCGGTGYREHLDSNGDCVREYCDKCNGGKEIDIECSCRK